MQTLAFKDYSTLGLRSRGMSNRLVADVVLLLLIALYPVLVTRDIIHSMQVCCAARSVQTRHFLQFLLTSDA